MGERKEEVVGQGRRRALWQPHIRWARVRAQVQAGRARRGNWCRSDANRQVGFRSLES